MEEGSFNEYPEDFEAEANPGFETGEIEVDENYEPTEDEIVEYAQYLGFEFPEDEELLWIAREGLKAPLPEPWKPCRNHEGDIYFFNFQSGESIWEHPSDSYFRGLFQQKKEEKQQQQSEAPSPTQNLFEGNQPAPLQKDQLPESEEAPLADELIENSAHFGEGQDDDDDDDQEDAKEPQRAQEHEFTLAQKELVTISDDKPRDEFKLYDSDDDAPRSNFITETQGELPSDIAIVDGPPSDQNSESLDFAQVFDQASMGGQPNGGVVEQPEQFSADLGLGQGHGHGALGEESKDASEEKKPMRPPDSQIEQRVEKGGMGGAEAGEEQEDQEVPSEALEDEEEERIPQFEEDDYYEMDLLLQDCPEQLRDALHMYQASKHLEFKNFYLGLINGMEDRAQLASAERPESEMQEDLMQQEQLAAEVEQMRAELEQAQESEKERMVREKEERLSKVQEKCDARVAEAEKKNEAKVASERADLKDQLQHQHQLELEAISVRYTSKVEVEKIKIKNDASALENAAEMGPEEARLKSHRGMVYSRTERAKEQIREQQRSALAQQQKDQLVREREERRERVEAKMQQWLEGELAKSEQSMELLRRSQEKEMSRVEEQVAESYMAKMARYEEQHGLPDTEETHDLDALDSHRERKEILRKRLELQFEGKESQLQKAHLESVRQIRDQEEELRLREQQRVNQEKSKIDADIRQIGLEGQLVAGGGKDLESAATQLVSEVEGEVEDALAELRDIQAALARAKAERETNEIEYVSARGGSKKKVRHSRSRPEFAGDADESASFLARRGVQLPRLPSAGSSMLGRGGAVLSRQTQLPQLGDELDEEEEPGQFYGARVRSAQGRLTKASLPPRTGQSVAMSQNNSLLMAAQQERINQLEGEVSTLKDLVIMQNAMATTLSDQQQQQQHSPVPPPTFGRQGSLFSSFMRNAPVRMPQSARVGGLGQQLRQQKRRMLFALDECDVELSVLKKVKAAAVEARDNWERERSENAELPITKSAVSNQMARDYELQIQSAEKQIEAITKKVADYNQAIQKVKEIQKKLATDAEDKSLLAELEALRQFKVNNKLEDSVDRSLALTGFDQTEDLYAPRVLESKKKVMQDQLSIMSYNQRFFQLYQRNLLAMNRNRENIKTMLSRQLNWLSSMKDEVNRTSSSIITARYRLPL